MANGFFFFFSQAYGKNRDNLAVFLFTPPPKPQHLFFPVASVDKRRISPSFKRFVAGHRSDWPFFLLFA